MSLYYKSDRVQQVQDSAVPIAIYYRNTPHQPVSLPDTYVDAGRCMHLVVGFKLVVYFVSFQYHN
jgi:hypothetical protein